VYRLLLAPVAVLFLTGAVVAGVAFWVGR